jgi:hypothetical protein
MRNVLRSAMGMRKRTFSGMVLALLLGVGGRAHAQCANPANAIVAENCLTGSPSEEWDVGPGSAGDLTIQGFATDISVNQGSTVFFKINTPASAYTIDIYRMGYYGGRGARKITSVVPSVPLPQTQPACATDSTTGLIDCGNWAVSASWQVPATAVSGIYFAHLIRGVTGGDSHIVFIVRNDTGHSAIMYQTADETWQAYNYYGAGSLYSQATPTFDLTGRSYKVSYNRPFLTRGFAQEWATWVFGAEFAMVQWLESNGYDVSYFTGVDAARSGALIKNHKIYMDSGHDEYWSGPQRANVQAARDAGVNLAFFSGNTMFWKTRWENSIDGLNTANRTLVCYKETLAFAKLDSQNPTNWTGTWRDPSFSPPADGGKPENALTGSLFVVNGTSEDNDGSLTIKVPAADGKMRFWRNTAAATLAPTATYTLPTGTLGYEWEIDADNGFRPAGAFHLSTATYSLTVDYLLDYGGTYGAGVATHHLMQYRAPSGALVFSAGSIDWSWGLNSNHDNLFNFATPAPSLAMQQATVNLLADMGVQPTTSQPGLVAATASTDTSAPTSTITFPAANATINTGSVVTVTGTASDSGGVVAGVELSSDGGATWHPATGRAAWSSVWIPSAASTTTLMSRAVDDSSNLEIPSGGVTVNVVPQVCPCSVWRSAPVPATPDSGDGNGVEIGMKFRADANGSVIGVRFYKASTNTGTHIGHLWSSAGAQLGAATFISEGSSGWQQVNFATAIPVVANTTYIVSYYAPNGHYSAESNFFLTAGVDNPPLHALASGVDGQNGVFNYGDAPGSFPSSSSQAANYWVDVVYTSSNTYSISGTISGPGGAGAFVNLSGAGSTTTTADAAGNYSFGGLVNGSYVVSATKSGVTFTPSSRAVTVNNGVLSGVNFTAVASNPFSISGKVTGSSAAVMTLAGAASATTTADASGNYTFSGLLSGSYTVTPAAPTYIFTPSAQAVTVVGASVANVNFAGQVCNCVSIWPGTTVPAVSDGNDVNAVEIGVKFRTDAPGSITALRFYKSAANTGVHTGHLWSSSGTLLGSATFGGETASGWQQATLTTPVQVQANTTYIVSYFAPSGHYSADSNYFATTGADAPPLHALASGVDGLNGTYVYTSVATGVFPNNSYASTNYWVDVLFSGSQGYSASGTISGGAGSSVAITGVTSGAATADGVGNYSFGSLFPGSYTITPSLTHLVFTPGSQTVAVVSSNLTGLNFAVPAMCPCDTIWAPTTQPGTTDSADALPYELGVKFKADADGYILGVRFYKAAANNGTHLGHLWSQGGTSYLSAATFTNESASGWQQVMFPTPVPVSANATYIASYFAPAGHYSVDSAFFATAGIDRAPLHALANGVAGDNGVFSQGASSALPTNSYNANNYWVDVIYATTTTHSLGGVISGPGAAGATVLLSGSGTGSVTTDAVGNYNFSGLANGTYIATPSKAGFVFSPASQTITVSAAHSLGVNFVSAQPTYVISGKITGGPGLVVSLLPAATASVTADSAGNYSFLGVANGTYTVTPSGTGYVVSPASLSVVVNGAAMTAVNFTANATMYAISGAIPGGGGTVLSLAGAASGTTTADASGNYSFSGLTTGSYTVTPAKVGLVFLPTTLAAVVSGANATAVNFAIPQGCPCNTLWQPSFVPGSVDIGDNASIEVGVKWRSDTAGVITGIRFYKSAANTGIHSGTLWSSTGGLLATANFVSESGSGWQQVFFATPVPIAANTTYIASYFAPVGRYSGDSSFFANSGVDAVPLHALATNVDGPNGVYKYGSSSSFPDQSYSAGNYWVDVIYEGAYSVSGTVTGTGIAGTQVTLTGPTTASATVDASGNYSWSGVINGSYLVTPSQAGSVFTPVNRTIVVSGSSVIVPSFAAAAQTFAIAGVVSGVGASGATVTLSGAATATMTTTAAGAFSFPGLANGAYAVTSSKAGFVYTPASVPVTLSGANGTANFSSAAQTFTLSGTISGTGGSGATVTLTGAATATVAASTAGVYSFAGLVAGTYTQTVTKAGFVFTPPNRSVTISTANVTSDFTSAQTFTLSGTISGTGGSGATVALTGAATATVVASTSGVYSFAGLVAGTYTQTVTKTGFAFTPPNRSVTISTANVTSNFTSAPTFTLSGTISGAGGSGATVTLSGAASATATANASGVYSFVVVNGAYSVTPVRASYVMTPTSRAVTVNGANTTANFTSTAQTFTISGTITGLGGLFATVRLTGAQTASTTSSLTGTYSFTGLVNGSYTVTPSRLGTTYTPANRPITLSGANATANFATQ